MSLHLPYYIKYNIRWTGTPTLLFVFSSIIKISSHEVWMIGLTHFSGTK